ncbi:hypothetical protein F5Y13DRAFT_55423 [Hypoxylon sp. FL1857]|nr:hypothetical protein F5Y13DRAFT_55423 [Hypoxylon sp. FL1857]
MLSSKLPLEVQVGIRDHWDKADAPVQAARSAVRELLGIDVVIEIVWEFLIINLGDDYPNKSAFVPSIAKGVQIFLDVLREILDSEISTEWTDTLLERATSGLRIFIDISKKKEPAVFWSTKRIGFEVYLPKGAITSPIEIQSLFKVGLLDCFNDPQASPDEWANLSMDAVDDNSVATASHQSFDLLPDISVLPRPDDLLLKPPYHLAVYGGGNALVEVQCSHSPTLQLLAGYLKRWCKVNHQDTRHPPAVEVKLHQSSFGVGLTYDRLTLSVEGRNPNFLVSPMVVLSFVEGVLGYKSVSVDGTSWIFRRDVEFRSAALASR